jgi:uncharacterized membrane protein
MSSDTWTERDGGASKVAAMLALKTFHIIAAILWLGNFAVTGVWSARAFASRDRLLRAFATREILFTDIVFTFFGAAAVVGSGMALAGMEGVPLWSTAWTRYAILTVGASALVWLAVLLPLEFRMRRQARSDDDGLDRTFTWWSVAGVLVTIATFAVVYLMVAKPA